MITSIHIAKLGSTAAVFRAPKAGSIPGLIQADGGMATRLGSSIIPSFDFTRVALVSRWADASALSNFESSHPLGKRLAGGWSAHLEPVRATGAWNGVAADLPKARKAIGDGPVVVVTQSKLNFRKVYPFLKANAEASANIMEADGLAWACAFAGPPRFGTISMWHSEQAMVAGAYGSANSRHEGAMKTERAKNFFSKSVYVRLRPVAISGSLEGKNPIPANLLALSSWLGFGDDGRSDSDAMGRSD